MWDSYNYEIQNLIKCYLGVYFVFLNCYVRTQDTLVPEENMHDNNSFGDLDRTVGPPDFTHVNDTNE